MEVYIFYFYFLVMNKYFLLESFMIMSYQIKQSVNGFSMLTYVLPLVHVYTYNIWNIHQTNTHYHIIYEQIIVFIALLTVEDLILNNALLFFGLT